MQKRRFSPIQLIKRTFKEWQEDKASRLAAALAFYTILSIPPLLVLLSTLVGQIAGQETAQQAIQQRAAWLLGAQGANAVEMILEAASQPTNLSLAAVTSIAVLLFGASGVFVQLQDALNTVWNVMPDPSEGFKTTLSKRGISFLMVLGVGLLLLILIIISSVVAFLGSAVERALPGSLPIIQVLNGVAAVLLLAGVFALVFKTIPDVTVTWSDVWVGTAVTTLLFLLGVFGIGAYLQYSDPTSSYGAAGSLIVLMIWVYYSAQIFFFGAEFTQVYANMYGSRIEPEEGAVRVRTITGSTAAQVSAMTRSRSDMN